MAASRPKHRVYIDSSLSADGWTLNDERRHYLRRVLRLQDGDTVVVFDGSGAEWIARLGAGPVPVLEPVEQLPERVDAGLIVTLVQCLARGDRMDLALQKATELGVRRVQPVISARTEVRLNGSRVDKRRQHWRKVLIGAAEQSGQTRIPELAPLCDFDQWLAQTSGSGLKLILAPQGTCRLNEVKRRPDEVTAAIGPEGGFTEQELAAAQRCGFQVLRLGPRVMRTETAGLALLAAVQTLWGDLG